MRDEKRDFARLAIHAKAILHLENQNSEGELENLSLKGAFVAAVKSAKTNDVVSFTICNTPISLKAKVVRVTDKGMGLRFERTLLD
jgi:hypothetical protein